MFGRNRTVKVGPPQLERSLEIKAGLTIITVAAVGIVLRKKYNIKIENAKQAGVDEWLLEMYNDGNTLLTLPKQLAEKIFDQATELVTAH